MNNSEVKIIKGDIPENIVVYQLHADLESPTNFTFTDYIDYHTSLTPPHFISGFPFTLIRSLTIILQAKQYLVDCENQTELKYMSKLQNLLKKLKFKVLTAGKPSFCCCCSVLTQT